MKRVNMNLTEVMHIRRGGLMISALGGPGTFALSF